MGKGIIKISYIIVAQWFVDGKKVEDVKSILMLPENYEVNYMHTENSHYLSIIVSSHDIPEVPEGDVYPTVNPVYVYDLIEGGKYKPSLLRIDITPLEDVVSEVLLDKKIKEGE